jgi:hypothetical protein
MNLFIRQRLREAISGENNGLKIACNTMSVATWTDGYKLLINAIGHPNQNPETWNKIKEPIKNWKQDDVNIGNEIKQTHMSGDSMVDESNTWWAAIQSTICK